MVDKYQWLWNRLAPMPWNAQNGLTQRRDEIIQLWQLFDRLQPKTVLEIGVSQGGTFAGWCQLAPADALIIGIDKETNDCYPRAGNQVNPDIADHTETMTEDGGGMYALKRRGSNQTLVAIKGWSYEPTTVQRLLTALGTRQIDFIFHDASHEAIMTSKDFEIYWPLVAPGGVMAFHDIGYSSVPEVDKWRWWREIRDRYKSYAYQLPDEADLSMGIGVLFKGPNGN